MGSNDNDASQSGFCTPGFVSPAKHCCKPSQPRLETFAAT
ncbi:MAG: hypothetical protein DMG89_04180 [Acidobacteria bacterium]|nr:MAG: hypothetical protein DMG89_04180 [Acidobacteriota bacterium]